MAARIAVPAALAAAVVLSFVYWPAATTDVSAQEPAVTPQPPPSGEQAASKATDVPPLQPQRFPPWYTDALRDRLDLEESDVVLLEEQLAADPEDLPARLKLLAYHQRADRADRPEDRAKQGEHTLWLIEHHPESELLHSPFARFLPDGPTPEEYQRAYILWDAVTRANPDNATIQWNASMFFGNSDPNLRLKYLEAAAVADPNHAFALRPLAYLYARSLITPGPLTAKSEAGLEASSNHWVLSNAAWYLQSIYNQSVQTGNPDQRLADFAEHYFQRALVFNPTLERATILPQFDPAAYARQLEAEEQRRREYLAREARNPGNFNASTIQRLPVDAFPELPPVIAQLLQDRGCTVPQPAWGGENRNVIRGEFFESGQSGWAVLCSVDGSSALLAFRNDRDTDPVALATTEDRGYLQSDGDGQYVYSHGISPVGRDYIMRHYRAYGGPEPPPIDHQGIDDAFLGKASGVWYFRKGEWMTLRGAD